MRFPPAAPLLTAAAIVAAACTPANATPAPPPVTADSSQAETPTLVVFLTIDQLRTDYFTRFGAQLTGGLKRLSADGAFYVNGVHDHAITETAPGHAATMSGRFPVHTGIIMNSQGVNGPETSLIDARGVGASPDRFIGTTLTDWMIKANRRTKVLSVSRKDRGAILPIGKSRQPVFWFADGKFTTSTYYERELPYWVRRFNERRLPERTADQIWDLLLPPSEYPERDDVEQENRGQNYTMPKQAPEDSASAARVLPAFPWMDEITLAFALEGVSALDIGKDEHPDVLAVSLSTLDAVGHAYGPDSREVHDMFLRVDRMLGTFMDSLARLRPNARIVYALTGDHGVAPLIGVKSADPNQAATFVDLRPAIQAVRTAVAEAKIDSTAWGVDDGALVWEAAVFKKRRADVERITDIYLTAARMTPGILRADRLQDLAKADTVQDYVARRWLHMFDPTRSTVTAIATMTPYSYWRGVTYATHGTPHDYDARVPVIFYGAGVAPGRRTEPARVVDMAPTLARILRVSPLEPLDGVPLRSALAAP
ncbi:MAG: alkaline phosphatase family protein [Gemmatimonadaceae bacterium]|nr:alkaline phosphatase family protein [Gemmatimonadaceae bacterium]